MGNIFVIPSEAEESLTSSEIFRDVSTSLDMTKGIPTTPCDAFLPAALLFVIPSEAEESLTIFCGTGL